MHQGHVYRCRTAELGRTGYELGYRAKLANRVLLDMVAFYNVYHRVVAVPDFPPKAATRRDAPRLKDTPASPRGSDKIAMGIDIALSLLHCGTRRWLLARRINCLWREIPQAGLGFMVIRPGCSVDRSRLAWTRQNLPAPLGKPSRSAFTWPSR